MKKLVTVSTIALALLAGLTPASAYSSGEEQTSWTQSALGSGE